MQKDNHTPDWWKGDWLVPMPKVMNPTEKDLRPLMMVEVLRKAWYSFSIKKMWVFLEKHKLIQINQFAYRRDREGPIAQAIMASILEEAAKTESSIVTSSWDEVHGFDNVTTNSSKISMYAKGLPIGFINHLADLDKDGHVYVRTPLAHHIWATELAKNPELTIAEIRNKHSDLTKVQCNKGIAQGDLDSCLRYIIFKDLTLISLKDDPKREKIYIRGTAGLIHEVIDLCYADDLVTFSGTVAGQQRKANIIGAITQIFNLQINVAKLRTAACNFGNEQSIPAKATLAINDGSGTITNIPLPADSEFKQLGFTRTISANRRFCDMEQFKQAKQIITVMCNTIQKKNASSTTKLLTVQLKLFTKIKYIINSSSWTLARLRELDVPINKNYRHCSKNMHSFPTELLYAKPPGLNFEQLSDAGIISKYALILRGLKYEKGINQYIHGFFQRAARFCGLSVCRGEYYTSNITHNNIIFCPLY